MKLRKGFTLIELLVVIAIIAILASILLPVFAQAREKARQTQCLSNIKQISLAVFQYTQDYDETYPLNQYFTPCGSTNTQYDFAYEIQPYLKNGTVWGSGGVFSCPSFPSSTQSHQIGVSDSLIPDGPAPWNGCQGSPAKMAGVQAPADKIMLAEKGQNTKDWGFGLWTSMEWDWVDCKTCNQNHYDLTRGDCDSPKDNSNPPWPNCSIYPRYRHNGVANFGFADGHAKGMARGSVNWYNNVYTTGRSDWPFNQSWYPW